MKRAKNIEVLARGVLVVRGKLLVCHTAGADNTYLPGGHIEFGEPARVSLQREIKEELGCAAFIGTFLGAVEHAFQQHGKNHCEINLIFTMRIVDIDTRRTPPSREGHLDFQWIPLRQLRASNLEPAPLRALLSAGHMRPARSDGWASTLEA